MHNIGNGHYDPWSMFLKATPVEGHVIIFILECILIQRMMNHSPKITYFIVRIFDIVLDGHPNHGVLYVLQRWVVHH